MMDLGCYDIMAIRFLCDTEVEGIVDGLAPLINLLELNLKNTEVEWSRLRDSEIDELRALQGRQEEAEANHAAR